MSLHFRWSRFDELSTRDFYEAVKARESVFVMTLNAFRGRQFGRALMSEAICFTEQTYPGLGIKIGAQVYLTAFYASFGFEAVSAPYVEDGIPHVDMLKPALA